MDASTLPKGQSVERTDGRAVNLPGIYTHKDTGRTFVTADGEAGMIQADSLMSPIWQNAWERTGEVPSRVEQLEIRKAQEIKDATAEALQKEQEKAELKAATKAAIAEAKAEVS